MENCTWIKHLENLNVEHDNTYNIYIIILTRPSAVCMVVSQNYLVLENYRWKEAKLTTEPD